MLADELEWDEIIENSEILSEVNFEFHDSKIVYFEQLSDKQVTLKLSQNGLLAVLRFDNIDSLNIDIDPKVNWVEDAYCNKSQNSTSYVCRIGGYTIVCEKITLEKLIDFEKYAKPNPEAFFYNKEKKQYYGRPAVYTNEEHNGEKTYRQKKALAEAEKSPASIDTIIKLTNELLMAGGMKQVIHPVLSGELLDTILNSYNDADVYEQNLSSYGLVSAKQLVWMKFTRDGYLGVVAASNDINFNTSTNSYKIINSCGKEWDESFVLIFPLDFESGYYDKFKENTWQQVSKVEAAIGNYLIANNVPILDYFSHNY